MIKKLYKKVKNTFFLNNNEKFFINNYNYDDKSDRLNAKKNILLNATEDYKTVCFISSLIKDKYFTNKNIVFFLPLLSWHRYSHKKNILIFIFKFYLNQLILLFRNKKWKKIYNKFNSEFISLNNCNILKEIKFLNRAEKILLSKINTKKDLQNLKINGILVGDLIYDTYLRYNEKTTVNLKDIFLIEVLAKTLNSLDKLTKKKLVFEEIFTNQLAYIYHGLLVRKYKKKKFKYIILCGQPDHILLLFLDIFIFMIL